MEIPRRTWRNPWLWPATQFMVLVFPLLAAGSVAREVASPMDAAIAVDLVTGSTGAWAICCALLLGVGGELFVGRDRRGDGAAIVRASSLRMLAVLLIAPASLMLIQRPDPGAADSAWRQLGLTMATGVVPVWAAGLLCRARGKGPWTSLAVTVVWCAVVLGCTRAVGRLAWLDAVALDTAGGAAGIVGAVGLYLAASERVVARLRTVLGAVGALSAAIGSMMTWWMAHPDPALGWVEDVIGGDASGVLVRVREPNLRSRVMLVPDDGGAAVAMPPGVAELELMHGQRVEAELSVPWLGRSRSLRLCAQQGTSPRRCLPRWFDAEAVHIDPHPARPMALMVLPQRIVVWDLETDASWIVERMGERVRWPCFDDDGGMIWRLQRAEGPYAQERLALNALESPSKGALVDVSAAVQRLEIDHDHRCADRTQGTAARLVRGRRAVARPHVLFGPGLGEDGYEVDRELDVSGWSGDGQTLFFAVRSETIRFYRPEFGVSDPVRIPGFSWPSLSHDGAKLAYLVNRQVDEGAPLEVRAVPGGELLLATTTAGARAAWMDDGHLLRIDTEGHLVRVEVASGAERRLYPPAGP